MQTETTSPLITLVILTTFAATAQAVELPSQPTDPGHPGSSHYDFGVIEESFTYQGRSVHVFLPQGGGTPDQSFPAIVFGHGHGVPMFAYRRTLEHLAKKGVPVIYPDYDLGLGDDDFDRMAGDYMAQAAKAVELYPGHLDSEKVIFSGHSNGGYVAVLAAGLPDDQMLLHPRALIPVAAAGYKADYLARVRPDTGVTLMVGEEDTKTPPSLSRQIFDGLNVSFKQLLILKSYRHTRARAIADHGSVRTFGWTGPVETPLHYDGYWKVMAGAAWDLRDGGARVNPYAYGSELTSTGISGFEHDLIRGGSAGNT